MLCMGMSARALQRCLLLLALPSLPVGSCTRKSQRRVTSRYSNKQLLLAILRGNPNWRPGRCRPAKEPLSAG